MRVFWPSDTPNDAEPGVVVGWRNSELDVFVVTILKKTEVAQTARGPSTTDEEQLRNVDNALRLGTLFRQAPFPIAHILERCGPSPLQALGTVNPTNPPTLFSRNQLVFYTNGTRFPTLHCPSDGQMTVQIILMDRPHPGRMQYLSLTPISLALSDKIDKDLSHGTIVDVIDADEEEERRRKKKMAEKLKLHTIYKHPVTPKESALPIIVQQANCSWELADLMHKNANLIGMRLKRTLSVSERVVESANNVWDLIFLGLWHILTIWVYPVAYQFFLIGLIGHRIAGEVLLRILDWRPGPDSAALKDISATAQQVDIRLQQFCYWPIQYMTLLKRKENWQSITNSHPEYIRFYNSLWLVANDVIIGIALGSYIIENASFVASQINGTLDQFAVEGLRRMIFWLMDWPGGLKLNTELAAFLGDLFLWVIDYWAGWMQAVRPLMPAIIQFIGFSSFAGASMPISLFSDLISLLTMHIYSFYVASAKIYNWQLTIIISLFHLFRGKKRNVLRNRIDSCDYDLDQLLLGTILFTLLFFLLPTVFVFYLTFASARMAIISLKAGLDTLLAFLNHFPLFALMLRIKDSRRLPGGIRFAFQDTRFVPAAKHAHSAPTAHIVLKVCPRLESKTIDGIYSHVHSPSHYLLAACSTNTSNSVTAFANITSHRLYFSALSPAALSRLYTARTSTVFSTACYPREEQASGNCGCDLLKIHQWRTASHHSLERSFM